MQLPKLFHLLGDSSEGLLPPRPSLWSPQNSLNYTIIESLINLSQCVQVDLNIPYFLQIYGKLGFKASKIWLQLVKKYCEQAFNKLDLMEFWHIQYLLRYVEVGRLFGRSNLEAGNKCVTCIHNDTKIFHSSVTTVHCNISKIYGGLLIFLLYIVFACKQSLSTVFYIYTVSQKKFPPLNSLQLCQTLTDFQNICTAGKRMKFATKCIQHHLPHLRHVATLPWEIKNSNFLQIFSDNTRYGRKCKQIAF